MRIFLSCVYSPLPRLVPFQHLENRKFIGLETMPFFWFPSDILLLQEVYSIVEVLSVFPVSVMVSYPEPCMF